MDSVKFVLSHVRNGLHLNQLEKQMSILEICE